MYKYVFNLRKAPLVGDQKRGYRRFQNRRLGGSHTVGGRGTPAKQLDAALTKPTIQLSVKRDHFNSKGTTLD